MEQAQNQSSARIEVITSIKQTPLQNWESGHFEGTSPPLFFIRTAKIGDQAAANLSLQFIFERDVLSGDPVNLMLQVVRSAESPVGHTTSIGQQATQIISGSDINAAFLDLQQNFRTRTISPTTMIMPAIGDTREASLANVIDQVASEIETAAAPFEINDKIMAPHSTTLVAIVRSICRYDEDSAQQIIGDIDKLRLSFLLLMQRCSPSNCAVRESIKNTWPEFDLKRVDQIQRDLLGLVRPNDRGLKREVQDRRVQSDLITQNLHITLIQKADQAMLQNLRRVVTGEAPPRHLGEMSNVPARITLGDGGIIAIADDRTIHLPSFDVTGVELPESIESLSNRGELSPVEYARLEELNNGLSRSAVTPYELTPHLTPQELERAAAAVERYEQLSDFERLLEIGKLLVTPPYYAGMPFDDVLRMILTSTEISEFKRLRTLLEKAQEIESLLDPTEEMAATMRFWGISADKSQRAIKFDRKLEELVARVLFYDGDDRAKNKMVRGNENYRLTTEPRPTAGALILETFLSSEVNSTRLALLATPAYTAIAEVVEHFDREIRPLTLEYNGRFDEGPGVNRPVIKELLWRIGFLRSLKNFYEGGGRQSGVHYLTWRQVQVGQAALKAYGLQLANFLALFKEGASEESSDQLEIPALN